MYELSSEGCCGSTTVYDLEADREHAADAALAVYLWLLRDRSKEFAQLVAAILSESEHFGIELFERMVELIPQFDLEFNEQVRHLGTGQVAVACSESVEAEV